jgi:hypothetical protein
MKVNKYLVKTFEMPSRKELIADAKLDAEVYPLADSLKDSGNQV